MKPLPRSMTSARTFSGSTSSSSRTSSPPPYLTEFVTSSETSSLTFGTTSSSTVPARRSTACRAVSGALRSRGMSTAKVKLSAAASCIASPGIPQRPFSKRALRERTTLRKLLRGASGPLTSACSPGAPMSAAMRVLVVDDEPAVRSAVQRALALERYDVAVAADGREALDRVAGETLDAVVLDIAMPHVDGLEVCRRMRQAGDRTPVLMLTARDAIDDRVAGLDAGADDYLVKPFALKELKARLRAL